MFKKYPHWMLKIKDLSRVVKALHRSNLYLKSECDEYKNQSLIDVLTGLHNRRSFNKEINHEVYRANRYGKKFCIATYDLNELKKVNDRYGHEAGDIVLRERAQLALKILRPSDRVFRVGGDEFFILLPETNIESASATIARLEVAFSQVRVKICGNVEDVICSASFGICEHQPGEDLESLLKRVDARMYEKKNSSRTSAVNKPQTIRATVGKSTEFLDLAIV